MNYYYVDKDARSTGEYKVHIQNCSELPEANNREYLGQFSDCLEGIQKAQKKYDIVIGCEFCIPECNSK